MTALSQSTRRKLSLLQLAEAAGLPAARRSDLLAGMATQRGDVDASLAARLVAAQFPR